VRPRQGDWYARGMYVQGSSQYDYHVKTYGHPSQFGYKDICHLWHAENWNPEELIRLYAKTGARYSSRLAITMGTSTAGTRSTNPGTA